MGEIDTKPCESVHTALTLFEKKACQNRCDFCVEREDHKELNLLLKELANCKVQLEISESTNKQATLKLEVYHKTVNDLSTQLKHSGAELDAYKEECRQVQIKLAKLESEITETVRLCLVSSNAQDESFSIADELKALKAELFNMRRVKEKFKGSLIQIYAVNEAILSTAVAAIIADKKKSASFFMMEAELDKTKGAFNQPNGDMEGIKCHIDLINEMENELLAKTIQVDYLQFELQQLKASSGKISDTEDSIVSVETEKKIMQGKLVSDKVNDLDLQLGSPSSSMQEMKRDKSEMKERVDFKAEIATVKADLQRSRSKIAAAEAVEAGMHLAVQQLAVETTKRESQGQEKAEADAEGKEVVTDEAKAKNGNGDAVGPYGRTILNEENSSSVQECEKATVFADLSSGFDKTSDINKLIEELKAANYKISDLRLNLEEATRRAELAEKAKAAVEYHMRKWKQEQRHWWKDPHNGECSSCFPPLKNSNVLAATLKAGTSNVSDQNQSKYIPLAKRRGFALIATKVVTERVAEVANRAGTGAAVRSNPLYALAAWGS